jgi:signal transduction histidine kinase
LKMVRGLAPGLDSIDQRFQLWLRRQGYDGLQQRAFLAITPSAAARLGSIARFLEQVAYNGRRLAKLNVPPAAVTEALQHFDSLCQAEFDRRFAAERDQLQLATRLVLENAFYQVREAEAQAFFGLYRAECEAAGLDDLLRRIVQVMAQAFQAAAGRLLLSGMEDQQLSEPLFIERGQPQETLIADPALRGRFASYWSYPFGTSAVMQLGFRVPYPWLPREQTLLAAAAARCQQAIERARMAEELRRLEAQARQAEEEERRRIGRDLHDEAGQTMAFLRLQLEMMERDAPQHLRPRLAEARDLAARTTVELRRIVAALSPSVLDRLGLETALRQLVARFRRTHSSQVRLRSVLPDRLPKATEEVVYRIAQECLQNLAKHSQATRVNVFLRMSDKHIRLSVRDNGAGFCADKAWNKPKSFGLAGMRERAALLGGTLAVRTAPGKGTTVMLELPTGTALVASNGKNSRIVN